MLRSCFFPTNYDPSIRLAINGRALSAHREFITKCTRGVYHQITLGQVCVSHIASCQFIVLYCFLTDARE